MIDLWYPILGGIVLILCVVSFMLLGKLKTYHPEATKGMYTMFMVAVLLFFVQVILDSVSIILGTRYGSYLHLNSSWIQIAQYFVFLPLAMVLLIIVLLELKEQKHQTGEQQHVPKVSNGSRDRD